MASAKKLSQVRERTSGIEDIFDNNNVAVLNAAVDILLDLDDTRAASCAVPATDLHELELAFATQFPKGSREIAEEMDRAFEDSKQDDWLVGGGDARADLLG